jgi:hypothetical protein
MFYFLFILILGYTIFTYMFAYACYAERVPRAFRMGLIQACPNDSRIGRLSLGLAWEPPDG